MILVIAFILQVIPIQDKPIIVNTEPQINNATVAVISGIGGAIIGLVGAIGTAWGKLRAQKYAYEAKIAELNKAKEETKMHREDEAYIELKGLLKERKEGAEELGKRIDKLEADHKLCEEKYDKVLEQTIQDKVRIEVMKQTLEALQKELTEIKKTTEK